MINKDQSIIILFKEEEGMECWGSLTELCDKHEKFSYHYIKSKKFPFKYKGVWFIKVKYRNKIF